MLVNTGRKTGLLERTIVFKSPSEMTAAFYKPLIDVWVSRKNAAVQAKKRFTETGSICNDFYESQRGFMWKREAGANKYFDGFIPKPKFGIVVAKAFEFVAIYGPHLFWQYASRKVISQRRLKLTPDLFGDMENPEIKQFAEQTMAKEAMEESLQAFLNSMMTIYLEWSQREQPGTLMTHGMMAVIESLVKGMSLLWPEVYSHPGSEAKYTRLQFETVDNLLIDADCKDPLWETAGYIMCRHINPVWEVERKFGLERGSLKNFASHSSSELESRKDSSHEPPKRDTFDCIEWFEVWSKVGIGPRTSKMSSKMLDAMDDVVGDFAYLCFAPTVDYPLNAPPERFFGPDGQPIAAEEAPPMDGEDPMMMEGMAPEGPEGQQPADEEAVKEMFQWRCHGYGEPFPCWMDNRWPVSAIFYHPVVGSAWPMASLAPGLGELIGINILTSCYIDMAWSKRREILAYHKSAATELADALNSDEAFVQVGLNDNLHRSINEVVQFLQHPQTQTDILQARAILMEDFNRRVGLNEMQYGESRTQIRVASDSRQKAEAISIRPEKMSKDVARWYSEASQLEMFLAVMHVKGKDLTHLLGEFAATQWDEAFSQMPVEQVMREMKASVEASEVRRPNKERDTANVQAMQQYMLPMLQLFAQSTTDTGPLNEMLAFMHEAMDFTGNAIELPPWSPPPPDEEQAEMAKADAMAKIRKMMAEAIAKEASVQKTEADAQKSMVQAAQIMVESSMPGGMVGELKHEQEIRQKEEQHQQGLVHKEQTQIQQLLLDELFGQQKVDQAEDVAKAKTKQPSKE